MKKIEVLILLFLIQKKSDNPIKAITIYALPSEEWRLKENTLYKYLQGLVKDGLVKNGLQDGKSKTFYITELGLKELKKLEDLDNV